MPKYIGLRVILKKPSVTNLDVSLGFIGLTVVSFFLKFLADEKVTIKPNTIKNIEIYILKGKSIYAKLSEK